MTKKNAITTTDAGQLKGQLEAERSKLAQLRFDLADRRLKRTSDVRAARRRIARILTALQTAQ
jgi:ribosomal protein L29